MGNFNNDCFPILSVNFVLNNTIAQHLEMGLSKNTWSGSWHIYLSQLRISFMKHLKRNNYWKKTNNYYCLYITIIKSKLQKFYWSSNLSNYFSTLIFSYLQIGIYKPYNHKARVTLSTLWEIYLFILKWNSFKKIYHWRKTLIKISVLFLWWKKAKKHHSFSCFEVHLFATCTRPLQVLQT